MIVQNPIDKAPMNPHGLVDDPVGSAPGEDQLEHRMQTVLNEWLKAYFAGAAFDTQVDASGATETKQFNDCYLLFGQANYPQPAVRPVMHCQLADKREVRCDRRAGYFGWKGEAMWNMFVRVSSQVNSAQVNDEVMATTDARTLCMKTGDQLGWLLRSVERQSLSALGLNHVKIVRGPVEIGAGAQFVRQVVVSMDYFYEVRSNL